MASRLQRAEWVPDVGWGCPKCHQPITPPMLTAGCIKTTEPHFWQVQYHCRCGTRYAVAVAVDLSTIDAALTATMPLNLHFDRSNPEGAPPSDAAL